MIIKVPRGSASTRKLKLYLDDIDNLPSTMVVYFTVKRVNDFDVTDDKAIFQKQYAFPADFTYVEPVGADNYYEVDLVITKENTTHRDGNYTFNVRLIGNSGQFIQDTTEGTFTIELRTTQKQG